MPIVYISSPTTIYPPQIFAFANSTKARRNVAIVKQFIDAAVSRRRRRLKKRLIASVTVQRAWRRHRLRMVLHRVVLATAATEVQLIVTMLMSDVFPL